MPDAVTDRPVEERITYGGHSGTNGSVGRRLRARFPRNLQAFLIDALYLSLISSGVFTLL